MLRSWHALEDDMRCEWSTRAEELWKVLGRLLNKEGIDVDQTYKVALRHVHRLRVRLLWDHQFNTPNSNEDVYVWLMVGGKDYRTTVWKVIVRWESRDPDRLSIEEKGSVPTQPTFFDQLGSCSHVQWETIVRRMIRTWRDYT